MHAPVQRYTGTTKQGYYVITGGTATRGKRHRTHVVVRGLKTEDKNEGKPQHVEVDTDRGG